MSTQVQELDWVVVPSPRTKPYPILKDRFFDEGWKLEHWGNGMMKTLPYSSEEYDFEEYDPAKATIPQAGLQRLKVTQELVHVRRIIIAHERNPIIDAPPEPEIWKPPIPRPDIHRYIEKAKEWDWGWLKYVAIGVGVIALIAFLIASLPAVLLGGAVVAGAALDPSVICELEDGTWAEVYYWFPQESSDE